MEEITHASIRFLLYGVLFGMLIVMLLDTIASIKAKKRTNKLLTNIQNLEQKNLSGRPTFL